MFLNCVFLIYSLINLVLSSNKLGVDKDSSSDVLIIDDDIDENGCKEKNLMDTEETSVVILDNPPEHPESIDCIENTTHSVSNDIGPTMQPSANICMPNSELLYAYNVSSVINSPFSTNNMGNNTFFINVANPPITSGILVVANNNLIVPNNFIVPGNTVINQDAMVPNSTFTSNTLHNDFIAPNHTLHNDFIAPNHTLHNNFIAPNNNTANIQYTTQDSATHINKDSNATHINKDSNATHRNKDERRNKRKSTPLKYEPAKKPKNQQIVCNNVPKTPLNSICKVCMDYLNKITEDKPEIQDIEMHLKQLHENHFIYSEIERYKFNESHFETPNEDREKLYENIKKLIFESSPKYNNLFFYLLHLDIEDRKSAEGFIDKYLAVCVCNHNCKTYIRQLLQNYNESMEALDEEKMGSDASNLNTMRNLCLQHNLYGKSEKEILMDLNLITDNYMKLKDSQKEKEKYIYSCLIEDLMASKFKVGKKNRKTPAYPISTAYFYIANKNIDILSCNILCGLKHNDFIGTYSKHLGKKYSQLLKLITASSDLLKDGNIIDALRLYRSVRKGDAQYFFTITDLIFKKISEIDDRETQRKYRAIFVHICSHVFLSHVIVKYVGKCIPCFKHVFYPREKLLYCTDVQRYLKTQFENQIEEPDFISDSFQHVIKDIYNDENNEMFSIIMRRMKAIISNDNLFSLFMTLNIAFLCFGKKASILSNLVRYNVFDDQRFAFILSRVEGNDILIFNFLISFSIYLRNAFECMHTTTRRDKHLLYCIEKYKILYFKYFLNIKNTMHSFEYNYIIADYNILCNHILFEDTMQRSKPTTNYKHLE